MITPNFIFTFSIDPHLGRLDYESLSQQALMEMVVSQLTEENLTPFKDGNSHFSDIDEWEEVQLDEDKSVISIDWSGYETESMPTKQGRICLEWLPDSVENLNINDRGFEGELHCEKLPKCLREFRASYNRLSGVLGELPKNMTHFAAENNSITGSVRLDKLPEKLNYCDISRNQLSETLQASKLVATSLIILDISQNTDLEGSIDLAEFPRNLEHLGLWGSKLCGTLNLCSLPPDILDVVLSENEFTGSIDLTHLPQRLVYFYLARNKLSGSVDLSQLPATLEILMLNSNAFSGTLDLTKLPDRINKLHLNKNLFHGKIDLSKVPGSLELLDFRGTQLEVSSPPPPSYGLTVQGGRS